MEGVENNEPIDYAALQEDGHKILYENICINPKSAYENSWLMMQLESELDLIKRQFECLEDSPIEYFVFDFDDDGEEEFIVSFNGSGWSGSGGNVVYFLKKKSRWQFEENL